MDSSLPFSLKEVVRLSNLGIDASLFKQGVLTMQSDKYICIKQTSATGSPEVAIIDMQQKFNIVKKPMSAEAVMMHPRNNIIALRAKKDPSSSLIQVYDLAGKKKLKESEITEPIVFWRWINNSKIGAVTQTAVYHIDVTNQSAPPRKIFTRESNLSTSQIIGYSVDSDEKWCSLCGIAQNAQSQIVGNMQLHSTEASQNQPVQAYISNFANVPIHDSSYKNKVVIFVERKHTENTMKLHVMEIGSPKPDTPKFRKNGQFSTPPQAALDFPLAIQPSEKFGVAFIITKMGYLYIYELSTCSLLFRNRISDTLIFQTVPNIKTDGLIGINKNGSLLSINMEAEKIIPFIMTKCTHIPDNTDIAYGLAQKFKLPGADQLFVAHFQKKIAMGDYKSAACIARDAPGSLIRNSDTIAKLKQLPAQPGQPQPLLIYFSTLLENSKLNEIQSLELVRPVIAQGKMNFVENWIKENKLTFTAELGDLVKQNNPQLALNIYMSEGNSEKVVEGLVQTKQFDKIVPYCQKTGFKPNFIQLLKKIVSTTPDVAMSFATMLGSREGGKQPMIDFNAATDVFLSNGRIQQATGFLVEVLKGNLSEQGYLQTKLLEMNLMSSPTVAQAIFEMKLFSHFDKPRIAQFCEKAGLFLRALENYTDIQDIRRVLLNTHAIDKTQLINYLARLTPENALISLNDMIKHNRSNVSIAAQAAVKYNGKIPTADLIKLFDTYGSFDGIYYFLGSILSTTEDPDIYYKYIQAAAKMNNVREVERVIRETTFYDPKKVKDFLMEIKLPDPRPLIYLCDKHGYVTELTRYLVKGGLNKYIEIYLLRVNADATPLVLGTMIDLDSDELYIKQLLNSIRVCPIGQLTEQFEKRNKLKILQAWLEARRNEGNQDANLHNALAKIYVDSNLKPEEFLMTNQYYDSKVVGKYCQDRDPHLAFTAYRRAWGSCDEELVELTNKNYLFRLQAKYLVERMDLDLWQHVLVENNPQRKQVIQQVVQTALPETKNPDEVSVTVKAFMNAELPHQLMELLQKIVLHNSDFSKNKNLQNLLILTAIKADTTKVMDYINRLTNIDGQGIAQVMLEPKYNLFEQAFVLFQKIGQEDKACDVLLQKISNVERAAQFAHKVNRRDVWSKLGRAQLESGNYTRQAMESFVRASDPDMYLMVIGAANNQQLYQQLIVFLLMAREKLKEQSIDGELIYAYGKTNRLGDMQAFISGSHIADVQKAGDRCYDEKLWEAAKLLFTNVGNNAKLASTLVNLMQFQAALQAAKKANTPKTWKEVNMACVRHKEFRLAEQAGMHIIIHPDHLEDLIKHYEKYGYYEELIQLLENGLALERSHMGIYTELGVIYAKYHPERLMDHLQTYIQKVNIPKLLRACDRYKMWSQAVFLHTNYDEFDNAILTMMDHAPTAWKHDLFVKNVTRVANQELFYRSIRFYLEWEPMLLNDLLKIVSVKIDLPKTVLVMRQAGHLPLVTPFLRSVQNQNVAAVNQALNQIYLENGDHEALRDSVSQYDNLDQIALAQVLEKNDLLEFRRISALLYRKHKRFQQSIALSKKDELYKDAMQTAAESRDPQIAEELLRFFVVDRQDKQSFCAMSYTCYELLHPDVVLEYAWRYGYFDFAMPFMIQTMKDLTSRVETVQKKTDDIQKKEEKSTEQKLSSPLEIMEMIVPSFMNNSPALPAPPQPRGVGYPGGGMMGGGGIPGMSGGPQGW